MGLDEDKLTHIVELIVAVAFVVILFNSFDNIKSIVGTSGNKFNNLYRTNIVFDKSLFDDKKVTGATVKAWVNSQEKQKNSIKLKYITVNGATTTTFGLVGSNYISITGDVGYSVTDTYFSEILTNANGLIYCIKFTKIT